MMNVCMFTIASLVVVSHANLPPPYISLLQVMPRDLEVLLESVAVCSSTSQMGLLNVHFPLLIHYTDITIVLPFLKVKGLLTDEDYLQLKKVWSANERRDAVEKLLFTLSRKCPGWELCFVDALNQSLHSEHGDYHDGHKHILDTLHGYGVTVQQVKKDMHFIPECTHVSTASV